MEKFRKGRLPSDVLITVETGDGAVLCKVVDVNEYGMRLCGDMTVRRGEDITASLDSWEVSGVVRWARRPYCGILFDSRAPEAAVAELRGVDTVPRPMLARRVRSRDAGSIPPAQSDISAT